MTANFIPGPTNKINLKWVFIAIGLILLIRLINSPSPNDNSNKETSTAETNRADVISNAIPGLAPVDIYLNMEKQGFTTEKIFSDEYGNSWICKDKVEGIDFEVSVFSNTADNVENVKATAMIDPTIKDIISTRKFFMYIASLPFDYAKPEETMKWLKANFNNDKASKIVADVKFTIYAPTKMVRILTIEKNN